LLGLIVIAGGVGMIGGGCQCKQTAKDPSDVQTRKGGDMRVAGPQAPAASASGVIVRAATPEEAAPNLKATARPEDSVKSAKADPGWPKATDKPVSVTRSPRGVVIEDYVVGTGDPTLPGGLVTVHFVARVKDGGMFQSTYGAGEPETHLTREFMPGVAEGIIGMKKGGKRRLIVPPTLAFGEAGIVNDQQEVIVPPNSTVMFDIELVDLKQSLDMTPKAAQAPMQGAPAPR
jgi:FKBP-type peptidyl-prolyl cis-trans isomerase